VKQALSPFLVGTVIILYVKRLCQCSYIRYEND